MKNTLNLFILLISFLFILSCDNNGVKISKPEEIGKHVFSMLQNLDKAGKQDYLNNFLTSKDIRSLATKEEFSKDKKSQEQMLAISDEEWNKLLDKNYNKIQKKAKDLKIEWEKIEYVNFEFRIKENLGVKICKGELFFKCDSLAYTVDVESIFDGSNYRLVEVDYLIAL